MTRFSLLLLTITILASCQPQAQQKVSLSGSGSSSCSAGNSDEATDAIFTLNGKKYYPSDLPAQSQEALYKIQQQSYQQTKAISEEYALRVALAQKSGKYKEGGELPPLQKMLVIPEVSDKEAKKFFTENKHRLPPNAKFKDMKGQIKHFMKGQQASKAFKAAVEKIKHNSNFAFLVPAPSSPKIDLNVAGHPTKGDKKSKVQVIEVSDYLCPHCQHAHHELQDILKKYGDKIQFTQINFALRPDGLSGTFVRGGLCVQQLAADKFWEYHDLAFATAEKHPTDPKERENWMKMVKNGTSKEATAKVTSLAKKIKVDEKSFTSCLNNPKTAKQVLSIGEDLSSRGVTGTPLFIVNQQKLAQGVHELEEAIKKAL